MSPVPPKTPRAPTEIPRERSGPTRHDRFALKTPSPRPGSIATVGDDSDPFPESEKTPVGMPPDEALAFRVSRTISTGTLDLRREMKQDIRDQNKKIESLSDDLGDVRVTVGKVETKLDTVVGLLEKQLDASNERQELTLTAKLNVGQQTALIPVENARARRDNIAKVVAALTSVTLITFLITTLAGKC